MIEVEGIVDRLPTGAQLGPNLMRVELVLTPWRRRGAGDFVTAALRIQIDMDLDLADAWLSVLSPGDGVRVECASLAEAVPPEGEARARATAIHAAPAHAVLSGHSTAGRSPEGNA